MASKTEQEKPSIAEVNDRIRKAMDYDGGNATLVVSPQVEAMGADVTVSALMAMASMKEFDPDMDPLGRHEFGEVNVSGTKIWFKFDIDQGNPDRRIVSLFLPDEY